VQFFYEVLIGHAPGGALPSDYYSRCDAKGRCGPLVVRIEHGIENAIVFSWRAAAVEASHVPISAHSEAHRRQRRRRRDAEAEPDFVVAWWQHPNTGWALWFEGDLAVPPPSPPPLVEPWGIASSAAMDGRVAQAWRRDRRAKRKRRTKRGLLNETVALLTASSHSHLHPPSTPAAPEGRTRSSPVAAVATA
jgi:hypothetical protein